MKRQVLKAAGIILAVVIVLIIGLYLSLNIIVRQAIQRVVPAVTGTPASVGSVDISLFKGHIGLNDLKIGNPQGFKAPDFLVLRSVQADFNPLAVFHDKIVIRQITIDGAAISVELNQQGLNNISVLQQQIKSNTDSAGTAAQKPAAGKKQAASASGGKKIAVRELKIVQSSMVLGIGGQSTTVDVPDITLSHVGEDSGVTLAQLTEQVLDSLSIDAVKSMGRAMQKQLMQDLNRNIPKGLQRLGVTF